LKGRKRPLPPQRPQPTLPSPTVLFGRRMIELNGGDSPPSHGPLPSHHLVYG